MGGLKTVGSFVDGGVLRNTQHSECASTNWDAPSLANLQTVDQLSYGKGLSSHKVFPDPRDLASPTSAK